MRKMSAAIDFVGDTGEAIITGDCLAEGDAVLIRSGGELWNTLREYGLDCGDVESILNVISSINMLSV